MSSTCLSLGASSDMESKGSLATYFLAKLSPSFILSYFIISTHLFLALFLNFLLQTVGKSS